MGRKDSPTITARFGGGSMSKNYLIGFVMFIFSHFIDMTRQMCLQHEHD